MADERDPRVSKRYRDLGAEEPPRALDEAILAASRRAVDSRPAPLVVPAGRRGWYFPVAAAAVITLAVAVTVQVERQKPDGEVVVATAPPQPRMQEQAAPQAKEEKVEPFAQKAPAGSGITPERKRQAATSAPTDTVGIRGSGPAVSPAAPPAQAAPPPQPTPSPNDEALRDLAKANEATVMRAPSRAEAPASQARGDAAEVRRKESAPAAAAKPAPTAGASGSVSAMIASPETQLEQIAELRKQGKHEEADKALEEFRKRYPDYRLSDEMKAKVEKK